jgi:hypothetical protein
MLPSNKRKGSPIDLRRFTSISPLFFYYFFSPNHSWGSLQSIGEWEKRQEKEGKRVPPPQFNRNFTWERKSDKKERWARREGRRPLVQSQGRGKAIRKRDGQGREEGKRDT